MLKLFFTPCLTRIFLWRIQDSSSTRVAAMGATQTIAVTYGVIGAASITGNAIFCFLLCKKPFLLKKPHNILLLTLATADMLTGKNRMISFEVTLCLKVTVF